MEKSSKGEEMKLSEIYFGAIDVIHERGWCQFELQSKSGSVCMMGAMRVASDSFADEAKKYFADTVFPKLIVIEANDHVCQTADDACAFLEIAACCAAAERK